MRYTFFSEICRNMYCTPRRFLQVAIILCVLLVALVSISGTGETVHAQGGYCSTSSCPDNLCNAVGQISESQTHLRGIEAEIEVADPQIRDGQWSLMRVLVRQVCSHPSGRCFAEIGWEKNPCFTTLGCSWYGSWKRQTRHVALRRNPYDQTTWHWDIANTSPGWRHTYTLQLDTGNLGWEYYIGDGLVAHLWTGFAVPDYGMGGGEVPSPPNNAMGVSGFQYVRYMDASRNWHNVNDQYILWSNLPSVYNAVRIGPNAWQVYGCNN